jgi:hypothetical protein
MSYDEEQQRKSRFVVETPTARREVVQTQTTRIPERSGFSTGMVAAVALTAIAATAIIFLFLMNRGDEETNVNISTRPAATTATPSTLIVQQPATQPSPIIIQQAPTTTQPAPVIITQPADTVPAAPPPASAPSVPDDSAVQNSLSKKLQDDADVGATDIIATVISGRATLTGTVRSSDLKRRAERLALSVKGVRTVDNQIAVLNSPDATGTP